MQRFEYDVTRHSADTFRELTFYCSEKGECTLDTVPQEQTDILKALLNQRGWEGWELIQLAFGDNGLIAFWKRAIRK
jgi:hypothetical protein